MDNAQFRREVQEALDVARETKSYLNKASEYLSSAGNWGIWDMLGGGFFSTVIKHSKLDDAQRELENAKNSVRRLQKELRDLDRAIDVRIDIDGFLKFADYFFDGLVADWLVQSKIRDAQSQVEEANRKVDYIIAELLNL